MQSREYAEAPKPKTLKKKAENYWYHYKWHTIVGFIILTFGAYLVYDAVSREKYDATVTLALSGYIAPEVQTALEEQLELYVPDFDGDGNPNVMVNAIQMPGDIANYEMMIASQTKFVMEFSSGDSMMFILDEEQYQSLMDQSTPDDIEVETEPMELFAQLPEGVVGTVEEGTKYMMADAPLFDNSLLRTLDNNYHLFLVMRSDELPMVNKDEKSRRIYEQNLEFWHNIITDNRINGPAQ